MNLTRKSILPGITSRLLIWCMALMAIFYVITLYLFSGIRNIVSTSNQIVAEDFLLVMQTEQIMDTLLLFLENQRKFEILGREEYEAASRAHLQTLTQQLEAISRGANESDYLSKIRDAVDLELRRDPDQQTYDEYTVALWIDYLAADRTERLNLINTRMRAMHARGVEAQTWGMFGLVLASVFGISISLTIAYFLNRSMRELRKGISRIARDDHFQPVRVVSSDELGEVARAFNEMGARLEHEKNMRSVFISMLSHEIRTPLTSIREALSLIQDGVLGRMDERQAPFLDIARKETIRLSDLLLRLLQTSSLQSTSLDLHQQAASANQLVAEAVERIQPMALAKSMNIRVEAGNQDCQVLADREHIQQVLFNLLGNALKFSPKQSTVTIRVTRNPKENTVRICIADQGPGIPEDEQRFIFQSYYQGNNAAQVLDGAGLGLSISRQIILAHQGQIWLENSSPGGSIFCFTLPLTRRPEQEAP